MEGSAPPLKRVKSGDAAATPATAATAAPPAPLGGVFVAVADELAALEKLLTENDSEFQARFPEDPRLPPTGSDSGGYGGYKYPTAVVELIRECQQGHAVVVVSEGAGEELLGGDGAIDQAAQAAGAHQNLPPIGA